MFNNLKLLKWGTGLDWGWNWKVEEAEVVEMGDWAGLGLELEGRGG